MKFVGLSEESLLTNFPGFDYISWSRLLESLKFVKLKSE